MHSFRPGFNGREGGRSMGFVERESGRASGTDWNILVCVPGGVMVCMRERERM